MRVGNVQGSIWARPTEARTFFDVSFQRSYRDQSGYWKNTQSFGLNGPLALQHAVGQAICKVLELQAQEVWDHPDDADDYAGRIGRVVGRDFQPGDLPLRLSRQAQPGGQAQPPAPGPNCLAPEQGYLRVHGGCRLRWGCLSTTTFANPCTPPCLCLWNRGPKTHWRCPMADAARTPVGKLSLFFGIVAALLAALYGVLHY